MNTPYAEAAPSRDEVDALAGAAVLDFGTNWCGFCAAAQPLISKAFADHPDIRHIKVEDGKGRPLGRTYGVKLWPTLIFLRDGKEIARLVRPESSEDVSRALTQIADK